MSQDLVLSELYEWLLDVQRDVERVHDDIRQMATCLASVAERISLLPKGSVIDIRISKPRVLVCPSCFKSIHLHQEGIDHTDRYHDLQWTCGDCGCRIQVEWNHRPTCAAGGEQSDE